MLALLTTMTEADQSFMSKPVATREDSVVLCKQFLLRILVTRTYSLCVACAVCCVVSRNTIEEQMAML